VKVTTSSLPEGNAATVRNSASIAPRSRYTSTPRQEKKAGFPKSSGLAARISRSDCCPKSAGT
jgi:hypothetical protein